MKVFDIPLVTDRDETWLWEGQDWRDFLTDELMPQFPMTSGQQRAPTEAGTPYETFALHVRVKREDVKDAGRALLRVAQEQLRRASERGTVVLRQPPTVVTLDRGPVAAVNEPVEVQVRMRYALEDKHDG